MKIVHSKKRPPIFWVISFLLVGILGSCSSKPVTTSTGAPPQKENLAQLRLTSLEISYVLGHSLHRFVTNASKKSILAQSFRDQLLLKEGNIEAAKYIDLVKEAAELLTSLQSHPGAKLASPCRTPFSLKLSNDHEIQAIDGCRSSDSGAAVGKLIKNAEVLLYSED